MKPFAFIFLTLLTIGCKPKDDHFVAPVLGDEKLPSSTYFRNIEFSFSDTDEILSLNLNSIGAYLASVDDTVRSGVLTERFISSFVEWLADITNNPDHYQSQENKITNGELAIQLTLTQDSFTLLRWGKNNQITDFVVNRARRIFNESHRLTKMNFTYNTRRLIKPKMPKIVPVRF